MGLPDWYAETLRAVCDIGDRSVFFVVGCQKSGTTWVQNLLDGHPHVRCGGESHFGPVLGPALVGAFDAYAAHPNVRRTVPRTLAGTVSRFALDQILGGYLAEASEPGAIRAVGDKTPEHALALPGLAALYPDARFVHVIRDGRDAAVSGWHHHRRFGTNEKWSTFADDVAYFARSHWTPYITAARQAASAFPRQYLEVRYEALHADPASETKRILHHIGVDVDAESVRRCVEAGSFRRNSGGRDHGQEDPSNHLRKGIVGDWKDHFDAAALETYMSIVGPLHRALGYDDDVAAACSASVRRG